MTARLGFHGLLGRYGLRADLVTLGKFIGGGFPIGAFGAIAFTVGKFGPGSLLALGKLVVEFYTCCAIFVALVLAPIAWTAGVNILHLIRYFATELMVVVGTK